MVEGTEKPGRRRFKKVFNYFIQGFIILAPIAITLYALYWLFDKVVVAPGMSRKVPAQNRPVALKNGCSSLASLARSDAQVDRPQAFGTDRRRQAFFNSN